MENYNYLSILIPTHNEQEIIIKMIKRTIAVVPGAEIVVVDDGSIDDTAHIVGGLKISDLKLIKISSNRGKGGAVREGIKYIYRPITAQIDADLQFLPEEIPKLIKPILEKRADIVFGSRYLKGDRIEKGSVSFIKRLASLAISILISFICLKRYTDVFAGMKAWKTEVMQDINLRINDFGYEAEIAIMAKKKNYKIIEIPVTYKKRLWGKSKIKFTRDMFLICRAAFKTILFRI